MASREPGALRIGHLAKDLGVSYPTLHRHFLSATGLSPKYYLEQIRVARAEELLSTTHLSIKEIAALLGFHSAFHFSQQFKRWRQAPPSSWREANQRISGVHPHRP